ncbi:unnamed protein product, partial [Prorocentrum cordatum]
CHTAKGPAFGGHKLPKAPSISLSQTKGAGKGQLAVSQQVLRDKDAEILRLKQALQDNKLKEATGGSALLPEADAANDPEHKRLNEIAASLRQLGTPSEAILIKAKSDLIAERDAIKSKLVSSKPYAAQVQHWTTRIEAIQLQEAKQQKTIASLQEQQADIAAQLAQAEKLASELATERMDLEAQRHAVATKGPVPVPGQFNLTTMVPALDLSVQQLGELLSGVGADETLKGVVEKSFAALRELKTKAEAKPPAAPPTAPPRADMPSAEEVRAADTTAVPMDTDDIEELKAYYRDITGSEPPEEEDQIRAAAKRWIAAAENYAKKRRVGQDDAAPGASSGVDPTCCLKQMMQWTGFRDLAVLVFMLALSVHLMGSFTLSSYLDVKLFVRVVVISYHFLISGVVCINFCIVCAGIALAYHFSHYQWDLISDP